MKYINILFGIVILFWVQLTFAQKSGVIPISARVAHNHALDYVKSLGYADAKSTYIRALKVYSLDTVLVKRIIDSSSLNKVWLEWNGLNYIWGIDFITSHISLDSILLVDVFADSASKPVLCKQHLYSRKDINLYDTIPIGDTWIDSDSLGKVPRLSKNTFLKVFRLFKDYGSYVNVAMRSDGTETIWYMWDELDGLYTSYFANTGEVKTHGITSVNETTLTVGNTPLLSPNPITHGFTLAKNIQATEIRMYSMMGTESLVWNNCNDVQYFDTQVLPSGVYTVRIQCESGSVITTSVVIAR